MCVRPVFSKTVLLVIDSNEMIKSRNYMQVDIQIKLRRTSIHVINVVFPAESENVSIIDVRWPVHTPQLKNVCRQVWNNNIAAITPALVFSIECQSLNTIFLPLNTINTQRKISKTKSCNPTWGIITSISKTNLI